MGIVKKLKKLKKLEDRRFALIRKSREILEQAEFEGRFLTDDERLQDDRNWEEIEKLHKQIEKIKEKRSLWKLLTTKASCTRFGSNN